MPDFDPNKPYVKLPIIGYLIVETRSFIPGEAFIEYRPIRIPGATTFDYLCCNEHSHRTPKDEKIIGVIPASFPAFVIAQEDSKGYLVDVGIHINDDFTVIEKPTNP